MHRSYYPYTLSWLVTLLCFPLLMKAQGNNFRITPAPQWLAPYQPDLEKTPDIRSISSGYYLQLFEEQYHAELKSNYRHIIRKIVSEAGVQNGAEISVDYDPAYEQLQFHQLIIRRNGKVINKLNAGKFKILQQEKELSRFIYSGMYTAYYILDDVRKGDQIEYAYTLAGRNPIFEDKLFRTLYFVTYEPVMNYYKCIIAAPARKLHFKSFNDAPSPEQKTWQGLQVYEWNPEMTDVPEEGEEGDEDEQEDAGYSVPSWYNTYAYVQVSEYTQWQQVINWALPITSVGAITPALQQKVNALQKEAGANKALYMQKAIRFVQDDIRYMGIEMGEYSHRPSPPEKVLTQRFGDCKDKSLLLCALLQANGIEAELALVNTFAKVKLEDCLPSPVLFNHAIVFAVMDGVPYWIDPTINYQRGGLDAITVPDYQKALIIKNGNGVLTDVENRRNGKVTVTENFTLPADNKQPAKLRVYSEYSLQFADEQRAQFAETSMKDEQRSYLDYYKALYGNITADSALQINDLEADNHFTVTENYTLRNAWKADSTMPGREQFYVQARMLTELLPRIESDSAGQPMSLKYPYKLDYKLVLQMPADWSLDDPSLHIRNKYYRIDFTPSVYGKTVVLHYEYETYKDHVPAEAMAEYKADRQKLSEVAGFYLYWNPANAAGSSTNAPGNAISWVMVMLALLFAGIFGYMAMRFYKRSVLPVQPYSDSWPIGGWLFLLGFGIITSPFSYLLSMEKSSFFSNRSWLAITQAQDGQIRMLVFIAELAAYTFLMVYAVLLMILFTKRRDTFPAACIVFFAASLTVRVADHLAVGALNGAYTWTGDEWQNLIQSILVLAIWTPYLLKSERVRKTFVIPHPSAIDDHPWR